MRDVLTSYQPEWLWHRGQFVHGFAVVVSQRTGKILGIGPHAEMAQRYPQAASQVWDQVAMVPGTVNAHAHSFQHLLRGLAVDEPFLVWRDQALYRITPYLDPEAIYLGAKLAFSEMLLQGVTTVADFFYVHNHGMENDRAVIQAARDVGIRLVLARTFYDWDGAPDAYRETPAEAVARTRALATQYQGDPMVAVHPAPHSVHGASDAMIQAGVALARELGTPWHIHIAEEPFEVEECLARTGLSPAAHLQQLGAVDSGLIAIHLTWVDAGDIARLGAAGAHLAYCPSSNMFLADGVTPLGNLQAAGVTAGLGTDGGCSNNRASIFEEMRMAALLQKVHTLDATTPTVRQVWDMGTEEGARLLHVAAGSLEPGKFADFSGLDLTHLSLLPWSPRTLLANIVYAMSPAAVRHVVVGGRPVVADGRLVNGDAGTLFRQVQDLSRRWNSV